MQGAGSESALRKSPVPLLVVLMTGIAVAGMLYLLRRHREFEAEVHLRVDTIASMKAAEVAAWRDERLADVEVLAASIRHSPVVLSILRGKASAKDFQEAREWLELMRARYHYANVSVAGPRGEALLLVGDTLEDARQMQLWIAGTTNAATLAFRDPATPASRTAPLLSVSIALRSVQGEHLGYLLLGIDPEQYLFPTLRDWLGAGETGELLLIRREGDEVLFLNRTRLRPDPALSIRQPVSGTTLTCVRAILGATGPLDGIDYRGEPVVAASRPVPHSDWHVVAKMDRREALAPDRQSTIRFSLQLATLMLLGGALVWLLLRRQHERFDAEKYRGEVERNRLLSLYNSLTRHANDAILVFEHDGRIVEVNDRAVEMFGYTREEMLTMRIRQLKPEEQQDEFDRIMKMVEEKKSSVFETANRRKDGYCFPTEVSSSEIVIDQHRLYQSILRDISERKQAERQIQRLNHVYAVLSRCHAAAARAGAEESLFSEVCRIAVETGGFPVSWVGHVDPVTSQVLPLATAGPEAGYLSEVRIDAGEGAYADGPTGTCLRERRAIVSVDIAAEASMGPWQEAAAKHNLRSSICLPVSRRGATDYVFGLYSSEPGFFCAEEIELAEEVGESLSFALARIDLERDRETAERERFRAQERLEFALDAANEGYWDWDIEHGHLYLSPRFCTMLGYQPGELPSDFTASRERIHPEDTARVVHAQESMRAGKLDSAAVEFRSLHKDGHYIWVLSSAKVVEWDKAGQPRRIVGSRIDLTHRKSLEQQVLQSQKLESVGRLAGSVAHDFNNHLTVINGYASLLQQQVEPGGVLSESLGQINEAGQRAAALTRQLLALSRKEIEHREALDPNSVIIGLEKMIGRLMGENVMLQLQLDPQVGYVMADTSHLEQILMNLTINARDAVDGCGHVTIQTAQVVLPENDARPGVAGPYVRLSVVDNGSGMTPEVRQHIFEPFFTTKDRAHGTGLGLATVYRIVERSNGFIEVESEPGVGTSFHVFLPSIQDSIGTEGQESSSTLELSGHETVLVVEDEESVRGIAVGILKHYGYHVLEAANGGEALALWDRFPGRIELVISDLMMPGMSGSELVHQLQLASPELKVMYVSGYVGELICKDELIASGAHFLPKPYTPETLLKMVRAVLSPEGPKNTVAGS